MTVLFVSLLVSLALLMILFLRIEIDFRYERGAILVLNMGVLALELSSNGIRSSTKSRKVKAHSKNEKHPQKRHLAFFKCWIYLMKKSRLRIEMLSVPRFYIFSDYPTEFRLTPAFFALISLLIAYLDANSEKLYQKPEAYSVSQDNALRIDLGASFLLFHALIGALRLILGGKKKGKEYVRN